MLNYLDIISREKEILRLFEKSCLVKQVDNEKNQILVLTELSIMQRAYIQLNSNLNRDFYIQPLMKQISLLDTSFNCIFKLCNRCLICLKQAQLHILFITRITK